MCHVSKDTPLSLFLRKKEKFVSQKWNKSSVTLGIQNRREVKEILTMMGKGSSRTTVMQQARRTASAG